MVRILLNFLKLVLQRLSSVFTFNYIMYDIYFQGVWLLNVLVLAKNIDSNDTEYQKPH